MPLAPLDPFASGRALRLRAPRSTALATFAASAATVTTPLDATSTASISRAVIASEAIVFRVGCTYAAASKVAQSICRQLQLELVFGHSCGVFSCCRC